MARPRPLRAVSRPWFDASCIPLLYLTGIRASRSTISSISAKSTAPAPDTPEYGHIRASRPPPAPLGQGIANAVGMALAERILNARFGDGLVDHRTYVIASDGD